MGFEQILENASLVKCLKKLPHVRQKERWDCGIACIEMILGGTKKNIDRNEILDSISTQSIWTIDLALCLHEIGVHIIFLTNTVGPSTSYRLLDFYSKQLEQDSIRVNKRFIEAESTNLVIRKASVDICYMSELLSRDACVIIILLNRLLLPHHTSIGYSSLLWLIRGSTSYRGHYLILVGYCPENDAFVARDPAVADDFVFLPSHTLDFARKSFGTDEDLIVVDLSGEGIQLAEIRPNKGKFEWGDYFTKQNIIRYAKEATILIKDSIQQFLTNFGKCSTSIKEQFKTKSVQ
mmetsp:Transcript_12332/g.18483  ORF Transcript_12332/g.18483 Transcript_12332/m.18483 type:complete len:293 (-) Transcript_12332:103-981(-)